MAEETRAGEEEGARRIPLPPPPPLPPEPPGTPAPPQARGPPPSQAPEFVDVRELVIAKRSGEA
jgi:hypothetical protein